MTAVVLPDVAPDAAADTPTGRSERRSFRLGMRWKLLLAFGAGFTAVFVIVAISILRFSVTTAEDKVAETLRNLANGASVVIDADRFAGLLDVPPPVVGDRYPDGIGALSGTIVDESSVYPTDERYWDHIAELLSIIATDDQASPYSFTYTDDDSVVFVGSWGATGFPTVDDPPSGVLLGSTPEEFGIPADAVAYMSQSADGLIEQPGSYTDDFGTWISAFAPIRDDAGAVVGGVGVDYRTAYVDQVRADVVRVLYPVFGISYLVLLAMVFMLSAWLTRRIGRLSSATQQVADGNYDIDLAAAARSRVSDEMTELAEAFRVMTTKVGDRERTLVQQVAVLKVEIDQAKREAAVAEITDSDFFTELSAKAGRLRAKVKALDEAAESAGAAAVADESDASEADRE